MIIHATIPVLANVNILAPADAKIVATILAGMIVVMFVVGLA